VAIEAGLAKFGDFESIRRLLAQVGEKTVLGRLIGNGAVATGRVLGIQRVPAAVGQGMPGYDPRSLKGNGVTYATSPQGADHTAGNHSASARSYPCACRSSPCWIPLAYACLPGLPLFPIHN
jgi:aldehyde:ferredoxin oxidoreductase